MLLFLANNPDFDTATDIVEKRRLTKSHVSLAVNALVHKGYLSRIFRENNRKTVHLVLCGSASPIVSEGRNAQKAFAEILLKDFSEEDARLLHRLLARMDRNIRSHLKEES
ncbi:MAG: MarR family winged helix-turn-helix transcriptional regulator [Dysosmobacter sp.]|nr:MarR family winged helix-turn-helix transcriptional regulator [Dysosmobacter sp.]